MGVFVRIFSLLVLVLYATNAASYGRSQPQQHDQELPIQECSDYECSIGSCVQLEDKVFRSCNGGFCPGEIGRKKRQVGQFVYRVLRDDEHYEQGLAAKDPSATKSVQSHVGCGSRRNYRSQYISTTANYQAAVDWAKGRKRTVVKIDLNVLRNQGNAKIIDLSDGDSTLLTGVTARNFANRYDEVLIQGFVPPEAIVHVYTLQTPETGRDRCHC